jgi:large subunit ribosomal protein L5
MQVPKLVKICLNQGIGKAASDKKQIEAAQQEMTLITGQKAVLTLATKDISNFKLRKGMPVGVMVTLRGGQMYEFLDRFITSTMPRIRDFNGVPEKGFDGRGNYTMGIKEQIAFPEISIDKISNITGMDITFVTNTNSDADALSVLKELGLPFKQNDTAEKLREAEIENVKVEQEKKESESVTLDTSYEENKTDSNDSVSDVNESETKGDSQDLSKESETIEN